MKKNRFDHLEPQKEPALPAALQKALSRIQRFDHLEIGELAMNVTQQVDRVLCAHCGQYNEKVRTHCWACYRWVGEKASPPVPRPDLELILDGKRYHSADADLPEDVRTLMDWIQRDGYSKELLAKWRQWRATRNQAIYRAKSAEDSSTPRDTNDVQVFRGQRVSVITINGKRYMSLDKDLPPDIKALFAYLTENEVTPALMDHLRTFGTKVKYRPPNTPDPTDGDVSFWDTVGSLLGNRWGP
jgi:hypothetical protein